VLLGIFLHPLPGLLLVVRLLLKSLELVRGHGRALVGQLLHEVARFLLDLVEIVLLLGRQLLQPSVSLLAGRGLEGQALGVDDGDSRGRRSRRRRAGGRSGRLGRKGRRDTSRQNRKRDAFHEYSLGLLSEKRAR